MNPGDIVELRLLSPWFCCYVVVIVIVVVVVVVADVLFTVNFSTVCVVVSMSVNVAVVNLLSRLSAKMIMEEREPKQKHATLCVTTGAVKNQSYCTDALTMF